MTADREEVDRSAVIDRRYSYPSMALTAASLYKGPRFAIAVFRVGG
jgi:hypothetical protein